MTRADKVKVIRMVRKKLNNVKVVDVAAHIGWHRTTIYYHLNESRAADVNLFCVATISDAIDAVLKANKKQAEQIVSTIK